MFIYLLPQSTHSEYYRKEDAQQGSVAVGDPPGIIQNLTLDGNNTVVPLGSCDSPESPRLSTSLSAADALFQLTVSNSL